MNVPSLEPKNGDFVAYLEEIGRRQLQQLNAPHQQAAAHAAVQSPPQALPVPSSPRTQKPGGIPATPNQAANLLQLPLSAQLKSDLVGQTILFIAGIVLIGVGLIGSGGVVPIAIGIFLLWRALRLFSSRARATEASRAGTGPTA